MRFLLAEPTAGFVTFVVLTPELSVNFHWQTLHLEVTERALRQKVKASCLQILLLLHMLQSVKCLLVQNSSQLLARKCSVTVIGRKAYRSAVRLTHFCFDVLLEAIEAETMSPVAGTGYHPIQRAVAEAALAFAHLVVRLCSLQVKLFSLF